MILNPVKLLIAQYLQVSYDKISRIEKWRYVYFVVKSRPTFVSRRKINIQKETRMVEDLNTKIKKVLDIEDDSLLKKLELILSRFNQLAQDPQNKKYIISFSGGKDSHVLLGVYFLWKRIYPNKVIDIEVAFSDTKLETLKLYELIDKCDDWCNLHKVKFNIINGDKSYWVYQFGYGYAVPDWKIRWCTKFLKIEPLSKLAKSQKNSAIYLVGRHFGESSTRDRRLANQCKGGECGVDKIKKKDSIDIIQELRNCEIWDLLYYFDHKNILYPESFNTLQNIYKSNTDDNGSLRMGCVMCPVVSINKLKQSSDRSEYIKIRELLNELAQCRRIKNPKTQKRGSIYVEDRKKIWEKIKPLLINLNLITNTDVWVIEDMLRNNTYGNSYSKEYVEEQHRLIEKNPYYACDNLPLLQLL